MTRRNIELDYLRVLCTFLIVCLHITGLEVARLGLQAGSIESVLFAMLELTLSIGLPPFFLLSGAFMISKDITSISNFYRRSFSRILPWSIFFFVVGSFFEVLNIAYNKNINVLDIDFAAFYCRWFKNGGSGVLWFIPALMGLYLLTPLLARVRKRTSLTQFSILTGLVFAATYYLFIPGLGGNYASYGINWFKGIFFIGHYMLGYCIYQFCKQYTYKRFNATTIGIIFVITLVFSAVWLSPDYSIGATSRPSLDAQEALPIILSSLLFLFFNKVSLPPSRLITNIPPLCIIIYLSHNYLPLPIIRFGLKWTGLWDTVYRDSLLLQFACYAAAIPFSILCARVLHTGGQYFYQRAKSLLEN